jgi:FKBP-type peptidyl-prolyl cis-trans isomerase SlpA
MVELAVGPATRVTLHFSLAMADGTLVDSNFDGQPATFEVGDGNLLPAFEQALFGLAAGQEATFIMAPEQAFGQHNPTNVQVLKRTDFPADMALEQGLVVSFADANRAELPGVIVAVDEREVTVDFNHPLAGHSLSFRVAIVAVEPVVTH